MTTPETPQPANRTELRDRVGEALRYWVHPTDRATAADAVLAVLPEPADRAAVDRARAGGAIEALRSAAEHMRLGAAVGPIPLEVRPAVEAWLCRLAEQRLDRARKESTELRRMVDEAQQQPDTETPADEQPTEEQIVRDHVTSLHLIGEQLAEVESWMWAHLAYVRERAVMPAPVPHGRRGAAERRPVVSPHRLQLPVDPELGRLLALYTRTGETPRMAVLKALRVRAMADGLLGADGKPKTGRRP